MSSCSKSKLDGCTGKAERLRISIARFLRHSPTFSGKMNFYLSAVNHLSRHPDDQPSIGIILCKTRDRFVAEYALRDINKPISISEAGREPSREIERQPAHHRRIGKRTRGCLCNGVRLNIEHGDLNDRHGADAAKASGGKRWKPPLVRQDHNP
jgi:YhcG PDDEXK nuclease domain